MSTTAYITTPSEGVNFNTTYTSYDQTAAITATNSPDNPGPPFSQGTYMRGTNESDFVFVKATAAVSAGNLCTISSAFTVAGATTTTALYGNLLGYAVGDIASGAFGWVQRAGAVSGGILAVANTNPNVKLYATATAGLTSSTSTTGNKTLLGVTITTTATSSATGTAATLNYPSVGDTTT